MSVSAFDQLMIEYVNRARLDPLGEAKRLGLDPAELPGGPQPRDVVAVNMDLAQAATGHSYWMLNVDRFSHTGAGGSSAGQRIDGAGYNGTTWAENIALRGTSGTLDVEAMTYKLHSNLFMSEGHRKNMLANHLTEIGVKVGTGDFKGYDTAMATQNFGARGDANFLTGVVYHDTDRDDFYSVGEGRSTARVSVDGTETSSAASGGYSVKLGGGDGWKSVHVMSAAGPLALRVADDGGNIKLDIVNGNNFKSSTSVDLTWGLAHAELLGVENNSLSGNGLNNILRGNDGNNSIYGGGGFDTLHGGDGNDRLDGGSHADLLFGGAGNDWVLGGAGFDALYGGDGNDTIMSGDAQDRIWGGAGDDLIFGGINFGNAVDGLFGGTGNDTIFGEGGFDMLDGGAGDDLLDGGHQADHLHGGQGNDVLRGGDGLDHLFGGTGDDRLLGGDGFDGLFAGSGNDTLAGGSGNDLLAGNAGHDLLFGGTGADSLHGGAGEDLLNGNEGNDVLTGNRGADTFVFNDHHGRDVITDFEAGSLRERIDLSDVSAIVNYSDLMNNHVAEARGDVLILTGKSSSIRLEEIGIADLGMDDFVF